jgi:hypothetical protein
MPYAAVLAEPSISISDRVGFALRFLAPAELRSLLNHLLSQAKKEGNLACLVTTSVLSEFHSCNDVA